MAGRDKKPALVKKQSISVTPSKDGDSQIETSVEKNPTKLNAPKTDQPTQTAQSTTVKTVKSRKANPGNKQDIKKNLKIKFKAKTKVAATKKLKLAKTLFKNNKTLDGKNVTIIKNGVKAIKSRAPRPKKAQTTASNNENKGQSDEKETTNTKNETNPSSSEPGGTPKKETKKRTKKQVSEESSELTVAVIESKKVKVETAEKETVEDVLKDVENELQTEIEKLKKKPVKREPKSGLKKQTLPKQPLVKQQLTKPRKITPKKLKPEGVTVKRKRAENNRKGNIIKTLNQKISIDSEAQNVINKLDLNVTKTIKKEVLKKRRHSIEKIPIETRTESPTFEQPYSNIFSQSRRSSSPRSNKRNARIRQSLENVISKRFSPYTTRSDSPARLLRNGKHRKLKNSQQGLLDGIVYEYKRRRKTSEISTSETPKFSDYLSESDSNFSMNSLIENGTSETGDQKDEVLTKSDLLRKEILESIKTQPLPATEPELQNLNIKSISTKFTAILKRSLSTETSQINFDPNDDVKPKAEDLVNSFTDTNSNDVKPQMTELKTLPSTAAAAPSNKDLKTEFACDSVKIKKEEEVVEKIASSPSYKVPEKSFILDQMKQMFNDSNDQDTEKKPKRSKRSLKLASTEETTHETVSVAKFYGTESTENNSNKTDTPSVSETEKTPEVDGESDDVVKEGQIDKNGEKSSEEDSQNENDEAVLKEIQDKIDMMNEESETDPVAIPEKLPESQLPEEEEKTIVEENEMTNKEEESNIEEKEMNVEENESNVEETERNIEENERNDEVEEENDEISNKNESSTDVIDLDDDLLKRFRGNSAISICIKETPVKGEVKKTLITDDKPDIKIEAKKTEVIEETPSEISEDVNEKVDKLNEEETEEAVNETVEESHEEQEEIETKSEENELINSQEVEEEQMEVDEAPSVVRAEELKTSPKSVKKESKSSKKSKRTSSESGENAEVENQQSTENAEITETPENLAIKENILNALGLQSLKAAEEAKLREKPKLINKNDVYTGTLKTVIKLNRNSDKKKRNPLKMTLQKSKSRNSKDGDCDNSKSDGASGRNDAENACYKVMKESSSSSSWRHGSNSSDTAGANRKSHYSNRSNMDASSEHASDNDTAAAEEEGTSDSKILVIPEKASSFSIHPDRLCSDVCAYCFGKFGLFDTPLHIAQIKSVERQDKILENEVYLMRDSCLCDACYRHVDRRSMGLCGSKNMKRTTPPESTVPRQNHCHVMECNQEGTNMLRRKWLIKMRKSVNRIIKIDLDSPGLHSIPVCAEHYRAVEHLMVCAICKRKLARNHIHYLGSECDMLNSALQQEGIPVTLTDKPVVCKLCRYFSTVLLKRPAPDSQSQTAEFFRQYKKKLLHFHGIEVMDEEEAEEPVSIPVKDKSDTEESKESKRKSKNKSSKSSSSKLNISEGSSTGSPLTETDKSDQTRVPFNSENGESRASTPSDTVIDYEALVPNLSLEYSDVDEIKNEVPQKSLFRRIPESVREAVEISKNIKVKKNVVERLGSNPSISVRQLFQGEEDLPLQANIDFNTVKERTPEGWEKSVCTIQYDTDTKQLWNELQKPYGNQSSFLRHLILLEKYFRNGDLTLSPNASHHAVNYSVSVQNRLRAYDNIPSNSVPMQPLTMLPFNQVKKSQSGIITTNREQPALSIINAANLPKNTPIPISQLNPSFLTQLSVRQKAPSVPPPGLISLQPGTSRPVTITNKGNTQKIKVPIGKNWKPTLIPVTSAMNPTDRRLSGLVQVISAGKPYHITIQDYNKMCQLKRNQELKKLAELSKLKTDQGNPNSSLLKPVVPRKSKAVTITPTKTQTHMSPAKEMSLPSIMIPTATATVTTANSTIQKELSKSISLSKSVMILPKIPKSLTVIPQTVPRKPLQPPSPNLSITSKPSTSKS